MPRPSAGRRGGAGADRLLWQTCRQLGQLIACPDERRVQRRSEREPSERARTKETRQAVHIRILPRCCPTPHAMSVRQVCVSAGVPTCHTDLPTLPITLRKHMHTQKCATQLHMNLSIHTYTHAFVYMHAACLCVYASVKYNMFL